MTDVVHTVFISIVGKIHIEVHVNIDRGSFPALQMYYVCTRSIMLVNLARIAWQYRSSRHSVIIL